MTHSTPEHPTNPATPGEPPRLDAKRILLLTVASLTGLALAGLLVASWAPL